MKNLISIINSIVFLTAFPKAINVMQGKLYGYMSEGVQNSIFALLVVAVVLILLVITLIRKDHRNILVLLPMLMIYSMCAFLGPHIAPLVLSITAFILIIYHVINHKSMKH